MHQSQSTYTKDKPRYSKRTHELTIQSYRNVTPELAPKPMNSYVSRGELGTPNSSIRFENNRRFVQTTSKSPVINFARVNRISKSPIKSTRPDLNKSFDIGSQKLPVSKGLINKASEVKFSERIITKNETTDRNDEGNDNVESILQNLSAQALQFNQISNLSSHFRKQTNDIKRLKEENKRLKDSVSGSNNDSSKNTTIMIPK